MLKVIISKNKDKVKTQILALESLLATDDIKSKAIHENAIKVLKESLKG